jgi:hypothetical protein
LIGIALCSAANICAGAATAAAAATKTAKAIITAAAEYNDQNQNDPQAAASTPPIIVTHKRPSYPR